MLPGETGKFDPDEIFRRVDQLRQNFGPEPSLMEQILSPSARRHAEAINAAVISAVRARQTLIDGLADCVRTYIEVHRGDLKIRGASFVLETCARQTRGLSVLLEEMYVGHLETYSAIVARIDALSNLTPEMKEDQKQRAYRRAEEGMDASKARFDGALDELSAQVQGVMREIAA
jgi:hypothetical protein